MSAIHWSYFDADGRFSGNSVLSKGIGPFPPPGHTAIQGNHGPDVCLVDGHVVNAPAPTPEQLAAAAAGRVRNLRDALLADCDWVVARATDQGLPVPQAWRDYRQALRDMPQQAGFPTNVGWPVAPAA